MKATKWKLTWLPEIVDLVPLQLWDFGPLITKKKPEDDDDIADLVNPQSVRGYFQGALSSAWLRCTSGCLLRTVAALGQSPVVSTDLPAEGCGKSCPHLVHVRLPGRMLVGRPNCCSRPLWQQSAQVQQVETGLPDSKNLLVGGSMDQLGKMHNYESY